MTLSMGFMSHIPDIFLVFDSVFLALGLASNLFVCFIMTRRKLVGKNLFNFYIFHLSMTEVVHRMVTTVLRIFTSMIDPRLLSHGECKAMAFFPHATYATVFFLLAGIAMDRKNHIVNPLRNLGLTGHRKKRIVSIWLFSAAISFPIIFGAHVNPLVMKSTRQGNSSVHFHHTCVYLCSSTQIPCKQNFLHDLFFHCICCSFVNNFNIVLEDFYFPAKTSHQAYNEPMLHKV